MGEKDRWIALGYSAPTSVAERSSEKDKAETWTKILRTAEHDNLPIIA